MQKSFLILAAFAAVPAYTQTCTQADVALAQSYTQMQENGSYSGSDLSDEGKREAAENRFRKTLSSYLKQKDSWSCAFTKTVKAGVDIYISDDKRLIGFSWDSQSGGTLHEYQTVLQYRDDSGRIFVQDGDTNLLTGIYADSFGKHGKAYLLTYLGRYGTSLFAQSLSIWQADNGKMRPLNIIRAQKPTHLLKYEYSPLGNANRGCQDFTYDKKTKTISFPLVPELDKNNPEAAYVPAEVSNRRIRYRFDGRYFVRLKP